MSAESSTGDFIPCSCGGDCKCRTAASTHTNYSISSVSVTPRSEKSLVVTYVDCENLSKEEVPLYMDQIQKRLRLDNTDTIQWFVPVRGYSKVEVHVIPQ